MTCAAARQMPKLVLQGRDLALVSPELPEWDEYERSPWRMTTRQIVASALCLLGAGFCGGILISIILVARFGVHS